MARKLIIPYTELRGFKVSPNDLIINEEKNGRAFPYEKGDLEDLLQDFRAGYGIKQAITVQAYDTGNGNTLEVVAGFRRARAAVEYQKEDPELTHDQKQAIWQMTWELLYLPILRGEVDIRDCKTPPGGWDRLDAIYPNLRELPIERQLAIADNA